MDSRKRALAKEVAALTVETVSPQQIESVTGYLDDWDDVGFDDKRQVVDGVISRIRATCDEVEIEWKI